MTDHPLFQMIRSHLLDKISNQAVCLLRRPDSQTVTDIEFLHGPLWRVSVNVLTVEMEEMDDILTHFIGMESDTDLLVVVSIFFRMKMSNEPQ